MSDYLILVGKSRQDHTQSQNSQQGRHQTQTALHFIMTPLFLAPLGCVNPRFVVKLGSAGPSRKVASRAGDTKDLKKDNQTCEVSYAQTVIVSSYG
jgi:hypothetical protein